MLVVVIAFIFAAYRFGWSGTGFLNKTLWDWLQLLIIPLALAVVALVFQLANTRTEHQIAKERYEQDQQLALDKQREDLLQAYLDRMSELLLKGGLRSSEVDAEVRNVARVRTITILFQLDARRIGYVFAFLREAGIMSTTSNSSVVSLKEADLHAVNWSQANLYHADLSGADLREANLREANLNLANLREAALYEADLREAALGRADLYHADLYHANLSRASLREASLREASLYQADFSGANLSGADLNKANLNDSDLSWANLRNANLSYAYLRNANLYKADLREANLSGAIMKDATNITTEELEKQAKSLKGATMPDGSIHE